MAVRPAEGEVVVETKRTHLEAAKANPGDTWTGPYTVRFPKGADKPTASEFMDWIEQVSPEDWSAHRIEIHVRRDGEYIGKWYEGPFSYEELQKTSGGGTYKIMCKVDGQLRFNLEVKIAGKPKDPTEVEAPATGERGELRELLNYLEKRDAAMWAELRALRGGPAAEEATRNAVQLGAQVLSTAVPAVAKIVEGAANHNPQPGPDPMRDLQMQFMQAAISKMLNPADPIETFAKMLGAVKQLGLDGGGNSGGGGLGEALIRAVPAATSNLASALRAMADGKQAEVRAMEIMRANGHQPALPAAPVPATNAQPAGQNGGNPVTNAQPAAMQPEAPAARAEPTPQGNYFAFIESRIVRVLMSDVPVDQAAEDVYNYLRVECPEMIDQLVAAGEEGLLGLFRTETVLAEVPQNPRLTEFVKKFIQIASEARVPDMPPPGAENSTAQPSA